MLFRQGVWPALLSVVASKGHFQLSTVPQVAVQTRDIAWPLVVSQACNINTDNSCHMTTNPDMASGHSMGSNVTTASGGGTGHSDQHVPRQEHSPQISTGQPRPWTNGLAFGGNSDHRHQQKPSWTQTWALMAAQTTDTKSCKISVGLTKPSVVVEIAEAEICAQRKKEICVST